MAVIKHLKWYFLYLQRTVSGFKFIERANTTFKSGLKWEINNIGDWTG